MVTVRARRDLALLSVTVLPLVCTALGLALWQGNYDEYLVLAGYALRGADAGAGGHDLAAARLGDCPRRRGGRDAARAGRAVCTRYRMPDTRALSRGARDIFRQTPIIRRIDTTFPPPPLTEVAFPYEALGGRLTPEAGFDALIDAEGRVRFSPVR